MIDNLNIGDKVRVLSKRWYDKNRDINGNVDVLGFFTSSMTRYLGKEVTISKFLNESKLLFEVEEDHGDHTWSVEMIEVTSFDKHIREDIDWNNVDINTLNKYELVYLAMKLEEEILTV